jgi:hypothetical protein
VLTFWKVIRPTYWMLDRRVRATDRRIVIGAVIVLGLGGQWLVGVLQGQESLLAGDRGDAIAALAVVFGSLFTLLLAFLNVNTVLYQLYLAPDLDLLMVAPIPRPVVFGVKLLQCSPGAVLPAILIGIVLAWFGMARDVGAAYYALLALLLLAMVVLVTSMVMGVVLLFTRAIPAARLRTWIPVILALVPLVFVFGQQRFTAWFSGQTALHGTIARALIRQQDLVPIAGGGVVLATASCLAVYHVFNKAFDEGWNRYREVSPVPARSRGVSAWTPPFPARPRPVMAKEWLEIRRDPHSLLNLLQPAILVVLFLVPFAGRDAVDLVRPIFFWFMLIFVPWFIGVAALGIAMTAIIREGPNLALLRVAPTAMGAVLRGKLYTTWGVMLIPWTVVLAATGVLLRFAGWQIVLLLAAAIVSLVCMTLVTIGLGALRADFAARDMMKRISAGVRYVMIALNALYAGWLFATMAWLIAHGFPESDSFKVIEVFQDLPPVRALLSDAVWVPLLLAAGHVLAWVGLGRLWAAAVRRLEELEI